MSCKHQDGIGIEGFFYTLNQLGIHDEMKRYFSLKFGVTLEELYGPSRCAHVTKARHEAMYLLRRRFKWSYPVIGRFFNRDHTTVMSALAKIKADASLLSLTGDT